MGTPGAPSGDLYCRVRVRPHSFLERHGDDVLCEVPITFSDAALGARVEVPLLEGKTSVSVRPGMQSGEIITLKGKGLPSLQGFGRGSQFVKIVIETPRKLTGEARSAFEKLRELEMDGQKGFHPARQGFLERLYEYFTGKAD